MQNFRENENLHEKGFKKENHCLLSKVGFGKYWFLYLYALCTSLFQDEA